MLDPLMIPIVAIVGGIGLGAMGMVMEERKRARNERAAFSEDDVAGFASAVERLEGRMKVLEAILDDEVPGWRRKYDD